MAEVEGSKDLISVLCVLCSAYSAGYNLTLMIKLE